MTLRWHDVSASRAHAHVSQGFYVFCCHKCHSKGRRRLLLLVGTERWLLVLFCWKQAVVLMKMSLVLMEMSHVLMETSRCFSENKPSFGLCGRMKCVYLLNMGVSDLLSVCCERKCDTCDSKKAKLQCMCVRTRVWESKFWSINNMLRCIYFVFWEGLFPMPVCAKDRLGLLVFDEWWLLFGGNFQKQRS